MRSQRSPRRVPARRWQRRSPGKDVGGALLIRMTLTAAHAGQELCLAPQAALGGGRTSTRTRAQAARGMLSAASSTCSAMWHFQHTNCYTAHVAVTLRAVSGGRPACRAVGGGAGGGGVRGGRHAAWRGLCAAAEQARGHGHTGQARQPPQSMSGCACTSGSAARWCPVLPRGPHPGLAAEHCWLARPPRLRSCLFIFQCH